MPFVGGDDSISLMDTLYETVTKHDRLHRKFLKSVLLSGSMLTFAGGGEFVVFDTCDRRRNAGVLTAYTTERQ